MPYRMLRPPLQPITFFRMKNCNFISLRAVRTWIRSQLWQPFGQLSMDLRLPFRSAVQIIIICIMEIFHIVEMAIVVIIKSFVNEGRTLIMSFDTVIALTSTSLTYCRRGPIEFASNGTFAEKDINASDAKCDVIQAHFGSPWWA